MADFKQTLLTHYSKNELTLDQYRTLIGLVNHDDEEGARKGLYKIIRRLRKNKARA